MMTAALDLARSDLAAGIQRFTYVSLTIFAAGLGAVAFRALVFLNDGQITLALANGVQAGLVVASLAVGLAIARVLTDRGWTLE